MEATVYGTRVIAEAFDDAGVPVRELVCAGGLVKNAVLTQSSQQVRSPMSGRLLSG